MTEVNYLDGLPSTKISTGVAAGAWKEFASDHARFGWSFYFADPYWWDGVYPNAVRCVWGNQAQSPAAWSLYFWTNDSTTHGVFFRVETRSDWRVEVNNDWANYPYWYPVDPVTVVDGATRFRMGTITPSGETIAVERYFDTLPICNNGLAEEDNGTGGSGLFAVSKTTAGYAASISGPRLHTAFSFPCDGIFSESPKLLTTSWRWSQQPGNAPTTAAPAKVGPDLGDFQIAGSGQLQSYNLGIYNQEKTHGPERGSSSLPHIEIDRDAPSPAIQRRQTEVGEAGAYASVGNKFLPYLPLSFAKTELVLTVTPSSPLRQINAQLERAQQIIEAIPSRTIRVELESASPYALSGMRFFFPTQAAPSGTATPTHTGPPYTPPFINRTLRENVAIPTDPPAWGDLSAATKLFLNNDSSNWADILSYWAQLLASYNEQLQEWNSPTSQRNNFSWNNLGDLFRRDERTQTDNTYSSGNSAAAMVHLSPRWRLLNVSDTSTRSFASHTSEAFRSSQSERLLRFYAVATEGITINNKGPTSVGHTVRFWWEELAPYTFNDTIILSNWVFSHRVSTASGQTSFQLYRIRNRYQDGSLTPMFEKSVKAQVVVDSAAFPQDVVFRLGGPPPKVMKALLTTNSAAYTTVASAHSVTHGVTTPLGELDVDILLAFE